MAKVNPIQAQKFLGGIDYPAGKGEKNVGQQGADENALSVWRRILDMKHDRPSAVSHEISEAR